MQDLEVSVFIPRAPEVVRRWWLEFPALYENAKEQPHRIKTLSRTDETLKTLTYWRGPLGREIEVPETFTLNPEGWIVDIVLPFGLAQRDTFTLSAVDGGTRVTIQVDLWCRTRAGRLMLPLFRLYARKNYPRTWRAAARWCEAATDAGADPGAA